MADMGSEIAELKRRVMALEADPHVAAATNAGKEVFANALAAIVERVGALEARPDVGADVQQLEARVRALGETTSELVVRIAVAEERDGAHAEAVEGTFTDLNARLKKIESVAGASDEASS